MLQTFDGHVGKFLSGHVTPAVAGVEINIRHNGDDVITVKTGEDGSYKFVQEFLVDLS